MSWSYDTDLAENKDKLRFLIGDTLSGVQLLSDEEINGALSLENSNLYATAESLCRSLSARFGREASVEAGGLKDDKAKQAEHFLRLAEKYALKTSRTNSTMVWTGTYNQTDDTPYFTRDLHLGAVSGTDDDTNT